MPILVEGYQEASCLVKTKKNDLLLMGKLSTIRESYIDLTGTRNNLPEIPYQTPVKIEVYQSQLGFKVLEGSVYLSSPLLLRIIQLKEAAASEQREYFRINVNRPGYVYDSQMKETKVELIDISLGGLMFQSEEEFEEDQEITIRTSFLDTASVLHCVVLRCVQLLGEKAGESSSMGYGCEFTELNAQQEDQIYRYMLKKQNDQLNQMI